MDTLRGNFDSGDPVDEGQDWDTEAHDGSEDTVHDLPPEAIGQDERRMQVRAYNHWAGLLGERSFPSIEDLEPHNLPDFGPNSVLFDFTAGVEDPIVLFLGDRLGQECGTEGSIERLSDVPPRSLLSRITDHYMQILANQAPIGFEAEFMNQRGVSILYRGILLPFSSDGETIDFIYGVINWKEVADQVTTDELLLEIDQAIDNAEDAVAEPARHNADRMTDWADSPAQDLGSRPNESGNVEQLPTEPDEDTAPSELPVPDFGQYSLDDPDDDDDDESEGAGYSFASLTDYIEPPVKKAIDLDSEEFDSADYKVEYEPEDSVKEDSGATTSSADDDGQDDQDRPEPKIEYPQSADDPEYEESAPAADLFEEAGLYDCLASARELAAHARASEDRSRQALYAAVGRAYDFSLAAQDDPDEYGQLIEDSGLTVQERAPMTPVVKLVFGADYDKTRLTEYAAVLSHAHRIGLERGTLSDFLGDAEGGLKGVVNAERRLRREESGKQVEPKAAVRRALAKKLRVLEALSLAELAQEGPEFAVALIRRDGAGTVELIGEVDEDIALIERAARKLVG